MFDLKNIGDMAKLATQAQQMQKQQECRHQEQIDILKRIAQSLEQILAELRKGSG